MAQVAMTIASRVYRVACDEGEEDHLANLPKWSTARSPAMREKFGEMGDQRLTVMAAVTIADELAESLPPHQRTRSRTVRAQGRRRRALARPRRMD